MGSTRWMGWRRHTYFCFRWDEERLKRDGRDFGNKRESERREGGSEDVNKLTKKRVRVEWNLSFAYQRKEKGVKNKRIPKENETKVFDTFTLRYCCSKIQQHKSNLVFIVCLPLPLLRVSSRASGCSVRDHFFFQWTFLQTKVRMR